MSFDELVESLDVITIEEQLQLYDILQQKVAHLRLKDEDRIYTKWQESKSELRDGNVEFAIFDKEKVTNL